MVPHGPVGVTDLELGEQRQALAVDVPQPAVEADVTPEPAVGHGDADRVVAGTEQSGDVIGVVPQPMSVTAPARRQHVLPDRGRR